eukprot:TRINITY_DN6927_c0_g1_i1.p1 TRINITY_DN6927_c0_g1~~TRINITY_DN6927_c0_g1_i1.p1  ORF type:complete len:205 (+),score=34.24 TRINITY_DN6927_c0_g1_i1:61-615(+)
MSQAPKAPVKYGIVTDMPESFVGLMKDKGMEAHAELIFYGLVIGVTLALAGLVFWALNRSRKASRPVPSSFDDFRSAVTSSVDDVPDLQTSVGSTAVFDVVETEIKSNGRVVKQEVVRTMTTGKSEPKTPTKRAINLKDLQSPEVSSTRSRKAPTMFSPTGDYILTPKSPGRRKSRKSLGEGKN